MQHSIRTFRASTMDDAMELVRRELGPDAVVVKSKEITRNRFLPWSSRHKDIEISAESTTTYPESETTASPEKHLAGKQSPVPPRMVRTLAETQSGSTTPQELFSKIPELSADIFQDEIAIRPESLSTPQRKPTVDQTVKSDDRPEISRTVSDHTYHKSLESLQTLMAQLERQSRPRGLTDVPSELFQQYLQLVNADVDDDLAREIVVTLRQNLSPEAMQSPAAVTAMQTALIEREMRCAPPIQPKPGRREIVTLVGPTGVGKTTTIAKLAGQFHLRDGLRVGLINVDNYRVGAIDQLQTYADILQIPLRSATNPDELRIAIDAMDDVDLVLVDTAGRSPFDAPKLTALRDIVEVSASTHVLLVLSLAAGAKMISRIADQFSSASPTSLVLTKLDEVPAHGGLLSVARNTSLPVSYITTGQDVPEDFESAHPNRLARLTLGRDQLCRV